MDINCSLLSYLTLYHLFCLIVDIFFPFLFFLFTFVRKTRWINIYKSHILSFAIKEKCEKFTVQIPFTCPIKISKFSICRIENEGYHWQ